MDFRVLGPVDAIDNNGQPVEIASANQRTVLAVLLAAEGHVVSDDRLIEAVWGDDPPESARRGLRTYVSRLRRSIGDRIEHRDGGYAIDVDVDRLDASRFQRLTRLAREQDRVEAARTLDQALALARGPAFLGVEAHGCLDGARRRLDELVVDAREALATAHLDGGDPAIAVATAEAVVAEHPLRESAWTTLVRALHAADRTGDALRAFQRAAAALAEAGLEPSAGLRAAESDVLAAGGGSNRSEANLPAVRAHTRQGLPAYSSALIGRDHDIHRISELLDDARVVTLVGPGGVGKTRLAAEVAARLDSARGRTVRIVELARVGDAARIPAAVADALGLNVSGPSIDDALARARELDVVLVLDNCEHVVDAAARVAELVAGPGGRARILATSRERLGVDGERSWPVHPLATASELGPAVELFVDRARAHDPGFEPGPAERAVVRSVVELLDGLPLAIEMAAARLPGFGLAGLHDELAERFDVLRGARRHDDDRHQTLRALIEWSENLLDEDERRLLAEMSVFAGPVSAHDIEAVVGRPGVIDVIARLADRSLVVTTPGHAPLVYRLFEMVRRVARERLPADRAAELEERHARHFLDVARQTARDLATPGEAEADRRVEQCFAEFRRAHRWGRRHDPAIAVGVSAALHYYAHSRQRHEICDWAQELVDAHGDALGGFSGGAVVFATAGYHANDEGRLDDAWGYAERSIAAASDLGEQRFAYEVRSDAASYRGDLDGAQRAAADLERAARAANDLSLRVMGETMQALALAYAGQTDEALARCAAIDVDGLPPSARGWIAFTEGDAILDRDPDRAVMSLELADRLAGDVGNRFLRAVTRVSLASLLGRTGPPEDAAGRFAELIDHWQQRGDYTHLVTTLRNLVSLFDRWDAPGECAELLGSLSQMRRNPTFGDEARRLDEATAHAQAVLGDRFDRHFHIGAGRDLPAAARWAVTVIQERLAGG